MRTNRAIWVIAGILSATVIAGILSAIVVSSTHSTRVAEPSTTTSTSSFASQVELQWSDLPHGWLPDYAAGTPDTFGAELAGHLYLMTSLVTVAASSRAAQTDYNSALSTVRNSAEARVLKIEPGMKLSNVTVAGIAFPILGDRDFAYRATYFEYQGTTKLHSTTTDVEVLLGRTLIVLTSTDATAGTVLPTTLQTSVLTKMLARARALHL